MRRIGRIDQTSLILKLLCCCSKKKIFRYFYVPQRRIFWTDILRDSRKCYDSSRPGQNVRVLLTIQVHFLHISDSAYDHFLNERLVFNSHPELLSKFFKNNINFTQRLTEQRCFSRRRQKRTFRFLCES